MPHYLLKQLVFACTLLIGLFIYPSAAYTTGYNAQNSPVYIRIFKEESLLEVWQKQGNIYTLYKSYKICKWSGKLGPKQVEGDKQSPEGFYSLTSGQMGWYTRKWRHSFNIGFPNRYDLSQKRTGTNLLIHGGCTSVGCYAMTNESILEIYDFIATKVENGQQSVPLHIFPFRMTAENMQRHSASPWFSFWQQLKPAYDLFEYYRTPPYIQVCSGNYHIQARNFSRLNPQFLANINMRMQRYFSRTSSSVKGATYSDRCQNVQANWVAKRTARHQSPRRGKSLLLPTLAEQAYGGKYLYPRISRKTRRIIIACNINKPSCKRWLFLKKKRLRKIYAKRRHRSYRSRSARRRAKHKRRYRTTRKRGRRHRLAARRRR